MGIRFSKTLSEDRTLILILVACEVKLLCRKPNWLQFVEIVRECWRIIPTVFVNIFMKIKVLVVSDWQLYVIVIEFFD